MRASGKCSVYREYVGPRMKKQQRAMFDRRHTRDFQAVERMEDGKVLPCMSSRSIKRHKSIDREEYIGIHFFLPTRFCVNLIFYLAKI